MIQKHWSEVPKKAIESTLTRNTDEQPWEFRKDDNVNYLTKIPASIEDIGCVAALFLPLSHVITVFINDEALPYNQMTLAFAIARRLGESKPFQFIDLK